MYPDSWIYPILAHNALENGAWFWLMTDARYIALPLISRYHCLDPTNRDISGLHCTTLDWLTTGLVDTPLDWLTTGLGYTPLNWLTTGLGDTTLNWLTTGLGDTPLDRLTTGLRVHWTDWQQASGIPHWTDWQQASEYTELIDNRPRGYPIGPIDNRPPGTLNWLTTGFGDTPLDWLTTGLRDTPLDWFTTAKPGLGFWPIIQSWEIKHGQISVLCMHNTLYHSMNLLSLKLCSYPTACKLKPQKPTVDMLARILWSLKAPVPLTLFRSN